MVDLVGKRLGAYQILEEIGRGGMAVVYKAYQPSLNRYVAIKVLREHLCEERAVVERFLREARAAAKLQHPNIIHIYDVGREGNLYYIVMDYIAGPSLAAKLKREGALGSGTALSILRQIGSALDYAHAQGVVHRDVKPSNILVTLGGQAVLSDFGIAMAATESRLTQTGMVVGTPEYMSPEQAGGQGADYRSDLYSLGVVLYEMLTGRVPFQADTPVAVLYKQVHEPPPPPSRINPAISREVEGVILRALEKHRERRYQTGKKMLEALARAGRGVVTPLRKVVTPGPLQRGVVPFLLAGVALVALIVLGIAWVGGFGPKPTPTLHAGLLPATATPRPSNTLGPTSTLAPTETRIPPTATVRPTYTPYPTYTGVPTATPGPPTRTPACELPADSQLSPAWNRSKLGCASGQASIVWAAWEPFEQGYMLWRSDTDRVYVLYLSERGQRFFGSWVLTPAEWKWDGSYPDGTGMTPPQGLHEPKRGFGWLWWTHLGGPGSALGWALEEERGFCVNIQPFERGLVFGSSTVEFCLNEMYNWATNPAFPSLLFALYGDGTWRRY